MDRYFEEDINFLIKNCLCLKELENKTILVTGATGLVGSTLIKTILKYASFTHSNIKVIAFGRNKEKMMKMFEKYVNDKNLSVLVGDVNSKIEIEENIDYIIHTAAVTKSKVLKDCPVETTLTAILGTKNVLDLASEKHIEGMVYLSSMEAYGTFEESLTVNEEMLGYIDLKNVRNGYAESKRMCEFLCNAYFTEYNSVK